MLNKYFGKIYVITCWGDKDRQESVRKQLKAENIDFQFILSTHKDLFKQFKYVKPAEASLLNSHMLCIKDGMMNNCDSIAILEDDFLLLPNWKDKFKTFMDNLPKDWSYLHFGIPLWTYEIYKIKGAAVNGYVKSVIFAPCSHFIALNKNVFEFALAKLGEFDMPADIVYEKKVYSKYKGYMPNESICDATSLPPVQYRPHIKNFKNGKWVKSNIR